VNKCEPAEAVYLQ